MPRRRRTAVTWEIEIDERTGLCTVVASGRQVLSGVPMSTARSYLRNRAGKGDKVYMVAPDGYRTKV